MPESIFCSFPCPSKTGHNIWHKIFSWNISWIYVTLWYNMYLQVISAAKLSFRHYHLPRLSFASLLMHTATRKLRGQRWDGVDKGLTFRLYQLSLLWGRTREQQQFSLDLYKFIRLMKITETKQTQLSGLGTTLVKPFFSLPRILIHWAKYSATLRGQ